MADGRTSVEADLLSELNRARQQPAAVAAQIEQRLAHYRGLDYFPPARGGKIAVPSKEGAAAVRDAVAFMRSQAPLPPLAWEGGQGLCLAAEDHLVDRGGSGTVGHAGADGSSSMERVARYGQPTGKTGECLWFGRPGASARQMVEDLIVDDGVPTRGHRLCILDDAYQVVGVRAGAHKTFGAMVVIEFAHGLEDDAALASERAANGPPLPVAGGAPPVVRTQWSLGECPTCRQPIRGGAVMELQQVPGLRFHKECFRCDGCQKDLVGVPYKLQQGSPPLPLCMDCWYDAHGQTCAGCGEVIRGGVLAVNGAPWHKQCHQAAKLARGRGGAAGARAAAPQPPPGRALPASRRPPGGGRGAGARPGRSVAAARVAALSVAMDYSSLE